MRNIEYTTRQGQECHPIYEPHEAEEVGIDYLDDIRSGVLKQGNWALTDDNFVVMVLKLGVWPNGKRYIRTCTGTFALDQDGIRIDTEPRQSRHSLSGTYRQTGDGKTTRRIIEFARLYAQGLDRIKAFKQAFPDAESGRYIQEKSKKLIERQDVRRIVAEELEDLMEELGIDNRYLLIQFKDLADDADQDAIRLGALKELGKITGLIGEKKVETTTNNFLGIGTEQLAALQSGEAPKPISGKIMSEPSDFEEGEVESAEDSLVG